MTDERLLSAKELAVIAEDVQNEHDSNWQSLQLLDHLEAQAEQIEALTAERDAARDLVQRWQELVTDEMLPRYGEMFEHLGLGNPMDSVVWGLVDDLLEVSRAGLATSGKD